MESICERLERASGQVGFFYKNLVTGESLAFGEEMPLVAASVIKLAVLVEVFRRLEAESLSREEPFVIREGDKLPSCGALTYMHPGLEVTLEDLFTLMIIHSDNTATNLLIRRLGMEAINKSMEQLGLAKTKLNRLLFDGDAQQAGLENTITAGEMGRLLEMLYRGEVVSPGASAAMIELLKKQRLNGKIPFALPRGTQVAHKTGEDSAVTHDVGIVYAPLPFVVCFCANGVEVPAFERLIQDISLELYRDNSITAAPQ